MNQLSPDRLARVADTVPVAWQPDIARLRRQIDAAQARGGYDRHAVAETECWIGLIEAELSARRRSPADPEVHRLKLWRAELQLLAARAKRSMG
jgi:hypothetical protein